tara:strand:- start:70 stop:378 length:309 start_codon:yes stop_codon:yes gene_type:complete
MKIIKSLEKLQEVLQNEELHPPEASLSTLNKNKEYKCGCGNNHAVDTAMIAAACRGRSIAHSGVGKGFILLCNTHATLVVTEGIFNYTFKSIWSVEKDLLPI